MSSTSSDVSLVTTRTISASTIAKHFAYDCDRFLKFHTLEKEERKEFTANVSRTRRTLLGALFERGNQFEAELFENLEKNKTFNRNSVVNLTNKSSNDVDAYFRSVKSGQVCYQPSLLLDAQEVVGTLFAGMFEQGVHLAKSIPDFVFFEKSQDGNFLDIFIVDAKSAGKAKLAHFVQVAVYMIILEIYIEKHEINSGRQLPLRVSLNGGVWVPLDNQDRRHVEGRTGANNNHWKVEYGPLVFDLALVKSKVAKFLQEKLVRIIKASFSSTMWHLNQKCSRCEFVNFCRADSRGQLYGQWQDKEQKNDNLTEMFSQMKLAQGPLVAQIPYITKQDLVFLHKAANSNAVSPAYVRLQDIEDLVTKNATFKTNNPQAFKKVKQLLSTEEIDQNTNSTVYRALMEKHWLQVIPGKFSAQFPSSENYRVIITGHFDPMTLEHRLFAWGILLQPHEVFYKEVKTPSGESVYVTPSSGQTNVSGASTSSRSSTSPGLTTSSGSTTPSRISSTGSMTPPTGSMFSPGGVSTSGSPGLDSSNGSSSSTSDSQNSRWKHTFWTHVVPIMDQSTENFTECHSQFVECLYTIIECFQKHEFHEQMRVGFFLYDAQQWSGLKHVLMNVILDESNRYSASIKDKAMTCMLTLAAADREALGIKVRDIINQPSKIKQQGQSTGKRKKVGELKEEYKKLPQQFHAEFKAIFQNNKEYFSGTTKNMKKPGYICALELFKLRTGSGFATDSLIDLEKRFKAALKEEKDLEWELRQDLVRPRIGLLETFVKRHFVLPVPGFYTFPDIILNVMKTRANGASKSERELSKRFVKDVTLDRVHDKWKPPLEKGGTRVSDTSAKVKWAVKERLKYLGLAIVRYRKFFYKSAQEIPLKNRPKLMYPASKFQRVSAIELTNPILKKLAFIQQFESVSDCNERRFQRVNKSLSSQLLDGTAFLVESTDEQPIEVDGEKNQRCCKLKIAEESSHIQIMPDGNSLQTWIMVPHDLNDPERKGLMSAMYFHDLCMCNSTFSDNLCSIVDVEKGFIWVNMNKQSAKYFDTEEYPTKAGQKFLLFKRFLDLYRTDKVIKELVRIDEQMRIGNPSLFLELVNDPQSWDNNSEPSFANVDIDIASLDLGLSQRDAVEKCTRKHLQCIWGPPGAGKTYFIGRTILFLANLHKQTTPNQPFTVLITSSNHSAINTCIESVAEKNNAALQLDLLKIGSPPAEAQIVDSNNGIPISSLGIKYVPTDKAKYLGPSDVSRVIGSTIWQLPKLQFTDANGFDLVVIDEGSQVLVGHAALAIRFLKRTGRLIVAGDHLQLPPIVRNVYPQRPPGEAVLNGSILECLLRNTATESISKPFEEVQVGVFDGTSVVSKLKENHRMNSILTAFTQKTYGSDYVNARNPSFKVNLNDVNLSNLPPRLFASSANGTNDVDTSLYTLQIPEKEEFAGFTPDEAANYEANIVTDIARVFIESYRNEQGNADVEHASKQLFVVTPHHVQRRAVRNKLEEVMKSSLIIKQALEGLTIDIDQVVANIVVDTVEKAQGKTAEFVIVCYGLVSPAMIANEAEFLFSKARLNVSFSRSRCKCVLICSAILANARLQMLSEPSAQEGYKLLTKFIEFSKQKGCFTEI